MYPIRPNHQRAKYAILMFYLVIGFSLCQVLFYGWEYYWFSDLGGGGYGTEMYYTVVRLEQTLIYVSIGLYYLTAVFFIMWLRRAYYNLWAASPGSVSYSEGWAAGAWFVPILNLFRPYQIMREIWTGTQGLVPHKFPEAHPPALVGYWWAAHISMSVIGYISRYIGNAVTGDNYLLTMSISLILQELVSIAAAVLAMTVIKRISGFEAALWEEAQHPSDSVFAIAAAEVPHVPPAS